ncbi:TWO-COMPONENT RESPONSE REGULATOR-LIKE APRR8-RELATED [Salix koriyanagi]|uniref:TWO-COMPONENT RESPONSE REGULATOR-LIKE APRR8-RELATED n=1 Tax=Salix koriyanagi TaxID=2511006 RepID=A0A9Q0YTT3_9ROSI|nr:TWO-COMPONENT RESPONSE REGULATOR-LIKE APRR8-RELATED [Salix koriyanagi]
MHTSYILEPKHIYLSVPLCACQILPLYPVGSVPGMTSEQFLSVEVSKNNASTFAMSFRILVVESDPTCLRIVSKMLQAFGYEVTTATRATDALHILREKEDEINLILTETHLPDMDQYKILETVRVMSSLPIVVFSADNNVSAMIGWLYKGAALYLMKPIIKNDVKNLWQLAYRKKKRTTVSSAGSNSFHAGFSEENASSVTAGMPSLSSTMGQSDQMGKRKELEVTDKVDEDNDNLTVLKKPKLVWTNELHNRFLEAIRILGIDGAHPKKILQHMNVPGLKKENVSSHLQKYRLSLKRKQDATQKTMIRDRHPSMTSNLQGGFSQFTNPQFFKTVSQSEYRNNVQNNLCSPVSMHSLGSVHSLTQVNSNHDSMLIPSYGQQSKQLYPTYPNCSHTGIGTTDDGNFSSFGQKGNHNVEEHLNQGTNFSNVGTHGPILLGNSQQQLQFPLLQPQPLLEKEDEFDITDIVTEARNELLVMTKKFLDDPNNDLW